MFKNYFGNRDFFKGLEEALPPVFTRKTASKMTGGLFTPRTLSNLDAAGKGPGSKVRVGKNILYEKNDFIDWLQTSVRPPKEISRPSTNRAPVEQGMTARAFWDSLPS